MRGWQRKNLGEILQKTETINPLQTPNVEFDYIDVSSISNKTFRIEETQHLKGKDAPSRARRLVKAKDVLFATVRPTLQRVAIVPEHLDNQVCSTGYFILRPKTEIDHRFVFYSLFTEEFMGQMESLQKGASYPAVTDGEVRAQMISVPSLPEQQRIVGILDEAFDGIATAKANAEKNLQNARALFESHLNAVFAKKEAGRAQSTLGEVCDFIGGSQPPKSHFSKSPANDMIRFIQIRDYKTDNHVVYIPRKEARRLCTAEDIMIGRYGPPLFQILRGIKGAYNVALMKAIPDENRLTRDFLFYFLKHPAMLQYIIYHSARAAGQIGLNKETIEPYPIALPSLAQQSKITDTIAGLETNIARLESIYQQKIAALDQLKKSLLHDAFSGKLTLRFAVISFPVKISDISTTDLHAGILAIAYQMHEINGMQERFGHVKAEKIAHMIEAQAGIDLGRMPIKDAAGPNDYPHLMKVESRARKAGYFDFKRDGDRYRVTKFRGFEGLITRTRERLGARSSDVDHLIKLMLPMDTQQAEIFCTVYAAWNNLLLDGQEPMDEKIVIEARENWHPDKLKIPRERFLKAIAWMREKEIIPSGKGRKVAGKEKISI